MGFNSKHHHHHDEDIVVGTQTEAIDHHEIKEHHHELTLDQKEDDDNCCNKGVAEFSQSDKMLSHLFALENQIPVTYYIPIYYYLSGIKITVSKPAPIRVFRSRFFTLPDIRVSIQSFQI